MLSIAKRFFVSAVIREAVFLTAGVTKHYCFKFHHPELVKFQYFRVNRHELKQHFPFWPTMLNLFKLTEAMFGVQIKVEKYFLQTDTVSFGSVMFLVGKER